MMFSATDFFAGMHHRVHEFGDHDVPEFRVRQDLAEVVFRVLTTKRATSLWFAQSLLVFFGALFAVAQNPSVSPDHDEIVF